jgi:hypothetical protein
MLFLLRAGLPFLNFGNVMQNENPPPRVEIPADLLRLAERVFGDPLQAKAWFFIPNGHFRGVCPEQRLSEPVLVRRRLHELLRARQCQNRRRTPPCPS